MYVPYVTTHESKVNLALTGLRCRKYTGILKRAIMYRGQSEVCCLQLPCSVRRQKHGKQSKSLDML